MPEANVDERFKAVAGGAASKGRDGGDTYIQKWDGASQVAGPAAGFVRGNNVVPKLSTKLFYSGVAEDGTAIQQSLLEKYKKGSRLEISASDVADQYIIFEITNITINGANVDFDVTPEDDNGTDFATGDVIGSTFDNRIGVFGMLYDLVMNGFSIVEKVSDLTIKATAAGKNIINIAGNAVTGGKWRLQDSLRPDDFVDIFHLNGAAVVIDLIDKATNSQLLIRREGVDLFQINKTAVGGETRVGAGGMLPLVANTGGLGSDTRPFSHSFIRDFISGYWKTLLQQNTDVTVTATALTTIVSADKGSKVIPIQASGGQSSGYRVANSQYKIIAVGYLSTKLGGGRDITFRVELGGINVLEKTITPAGGLVNEGFRIEIDVYVRTGGAAGVVAASGLLRISEDAPFILTKVGTTGGIALNASLTLDLQAKYDTANASNTMTTQFVDYNMVTQVITGTL